MQRQVQTLTQDGDVKGDDRDGGGRALSDPPADPDTSASPEPDEPTIVG